MVESTLIDDTVRYAAVSDVGVYVRNKTFDASSDPTKNDVEDLLLKASQKIDRRTKRAWRRRKISDFERQPRLSHKQKSQLYRRGARRGSSWRYGSNMHRKRVAVLLPRLDILPFDAGEGDTLEVLTNDGWADITSDGPGWSADDTWDLDQKNGILRINLGEFIAGGTRLGTVHPNPRVRMTFRYGTDESGNANSVSSSVPSDITEACAKWVAADLIHGDSLGSLITSGPENVPDQGTHASELFASAMNTLDSWAHEEVI